MFTVQVLFECFHHFQVIAPIALKVSHLAFVHDLVDKMHTQATGPNVVQVPGSNGFQLYMEARSVSRKNNVAPLPYISSVSSPSALPP